jgi:hypothetical protein
MGSELGTEERLPLSMACSLSLAFERDLAGERKVTFR